MEQSKILSERIKEIRLKFNLSQERFAKKIGLTGKTISAYENGRCTPPLKILDRITTAYGQPILTAGSQEKKALNQKLLLIKEYIQDLENIIS